MGTYESLIFGEYMKTIQALPLNNKTVFLRVDLNVPLKNGELLNDHRLHAIKPTLNYLRDKKATIILGTHIGRPANHEEYLSTKHLVPWFKKEGYPILFTPDLDNASELAKNNPGSIILLENLRFYPGEKKHNPAFAQQLAHLAEYYVNDAFALLHRNDTSITLTPGLFSRDTRAVGLLIEDELKHLEKLIDTPAHPFTLILGGGKVSTKIPLIKNMLSRIDNLLVCPAIVFTFLKALGKPVGNSLVEESSLDTCKEILDLAQQQNVTVTFPLDYQVARGSYNGPLSYIDADEFPSDGIGISIGPKTYELFGSIIRNSKTIFYNGLMGSVGRQETLSGINALLKAMAESEGYSVIGGGDSVAAAQLLGHADDISYLSTGGGATLTYLSGTPLPGLQFFR